MHPVDFLLYAIAIAAGAFAFGRVYRDRDNDTPVRGLVAAVAGLGVTLTIVQVASLWLGQTGDPWNNARLTPAVALHYGYQLYYPLHEGPVLSTVVGPVSFLAYWPIGFLHGSPTTLILAASALNLIICGALLRIMACRLAQGMPLRLFAVLAGAQLVLFYPSLRYSLFCIHADAPALLLGGLGAGLVIFARDGLEIGRCVASALCLALAVWAKQSLAPIFLAVALVAALNHGWRPTIRFLVVSVMVGLAVSLVFVAWLGFANLRDNMFVVPARHPWHQMSLATGEIYNSLNAIGTTGHVKVLVAAALQIVRESWVLFAVLFVALTDTMLQSRPGRRWPRRAWAAWFVIALCMLPTASIGRTKVGGEINHESFVVFFLAAAVVCWLVSVAFERGRALPTRVAAVLAVLVAINAPRALEYAGWRAAWDNQNEAAYRYDVQHPGKIYFPWNPLTSLLAEGKLYHFDYGVFDRNLGDAIVSPEHILQHVPSPRPEIATFIAHHDYILNRYFPDYVLHHENRELPDWRIFGPPLSNNPK